MRNDLTCFYCSSPLIGAEQLRLYFNPDSLADHGVERYCGVCASELELVSAAFREEQLELFNANSDS